MEQKATGALMDMGFPILNMQSAATGTGAGVYMCWSSPSGYVRGSAVCPVVLPVIFQGLILCKALSGVWLLAKIQGSSLR